MTWRKSSYSTSNNDCVEIATQSGAAYVRNSNHPDRGTLTLPAPVMAGFVEACRTGELDDLTR